MKRGQSIVVHLKTPRDTIVLLQLLLMRLYHLAKRPCAHDADVAVTQSLVAVPHMVCTKSIQLLLHTVWRGRLRGLCWRLMKTRLQDVSCAGRRLCLPLLPLTTVGCEAVPSSMITFDNSFLYVLHMRVWAAATGEDGEPFVGGEFACSRKTAPNTYQSSDLLHQLHIFVPNVSNEQHCICLKCLQRGCISWTPQTVAVSYYCH